MARRPKSNRRRIASDMPVGSDAAHDAAPSDGMRREEATSRVEADFDGTFPISPSEIEVLESYLGMQIDDILRRMRRKSSAV